MFMFLLSEIYTSMPEGEDRTQEGIKRRRKRWMERCRTILFFQKIAKRVVSLLQQLNNCNRKLKHLLSSCSKETFFSLYSGQQPTYFPASAFSYPNMSPDSGLYELEHKINNRLETTGSNGLGIIQQKKSYFSQIPGIFTPVLQQSSIESAVWVRNILLNKLLVTLQMVALAQNVHYKMMLQV